MEKEVNMDTGLTPKEEEALLLGEVGPEYREVEIEDTEDLLKVPENPFEPDLEVLEDSMVPLPTEVNSQDPLGLKPFVTSTQDKRGEEGEKNPEWSLSTETSEDQTNTGSGGWIYSENAKGIKANPSKIQEGRPELRIGPITSDPEPRSAPGRARGPLVLLEKPVKGLRKEVRTPEIMRKAPRSEDPELMKKLILLTGRGQHERRSDPRQP